MASCYFDAIPSATAAAGTTRPATGTTASQGCPSGLKMLLIIFSCQITPTNLFLGHSVVPNVQASLHEHQGPQQPLQGLPDDQMGSSQGHSSC
jgi:hypothetical protein